MTKLMYNCTFWEKIFNVCELVCKKTGCQTLPIDENAVLTNKYKIENHLLLPPPIDRVAAR